MMCMHFFHAIVYDAVRYVCHQHIRALPNTNMSHALWSPTLLGDWVYRLLLMILHDIDVTICTQCVLRLRSVVSLYRHWIWDECKSMGMVMCRVSSSCWWRVESYCGCGCWYTRTVAKKFNRDLKKALSRNTKIIMLRSAQSIASLWASSIQTSFILQEQLLTS